MPYKLRFVQRFNTKDEAEFMRLEAQFAALEKNNPDFPQGRRFQPCSGREPSNTLIWECELESMEAIESTLTFLGQNEEHERLFEIAAPTMQDCYTEIYKVLEL